MRYIGKFYRFVRKYWPQMGFYLSVTTIAVVLETVRPYWLKIMLEELEKQNLEKVWLFLAIFGASTIVGNFISAAAYFLGDRVLIPLSKEIREAVFRKILDLDFAYHTEKNTGSLISAIRRGDGAVFTLFFTIHNELYRILISLVVTVYFLARAEIIIAAVMIGLFSLNLGLIWWLIKRNLKTRVAFNKSEDEISGIIADGMINYETVKYFAAEDKESQRLGIRFIDWSKKLMTFGNSFRMMDIAVGTTSGAGMLLMLGLTVGQLGKGLTVGDLVMVSGFVTGFYYQFFNLFFQIRNIAKSMTDLEKYFEILDNEILVKDSEKPVEIEAPKGEIEFVNVGFAYPKNRDRVLDQINLKIEAGQQVAFVGRSGAGKTTLVKLLIRFYDPSEGEIRIDGKKITEMRKADLRKLMGVVPQEPILFNNTIKYNLAYGKEKAKLKEIKEVAAKANILEFIEKLPNKWKTEVGERGIKLSGGQKQRLAIARALLSDPKILIFDEATSNLDSESEKMIQNALAEAAKSRTVIVIAHRFSTIRNADMIVVLSNGSIAETGKHNDLIKKKGIYEKLWTLQSKGKLVTEEGLVG